MLRSQRYYDCYCWGFPTLTEDNNKDGVTYEICWLCRWEDDWEGGANGDYTLREAQDNFRKYLIMYHVPNPEQYFRDYKKIIELKKGLMKTFYMIYISHSAEEKERYWDRFDYLKTELDIEQRLLPTDPKRHKDSTSSH